MLLLLGIVILIIGVLITIFPGGYYELTEGWKNDLVGEPSKWYIIQTRILGIFCIIAGIGGLICFFIDKFG